MIKKRIYYLISFLLIIGVIGVTMGLAYKLTNGFQNDLTTFVVINSNGKLVINGSNEYIAFESPNTFSIKGLSSNQFECNIYGNSNYKYLVNGSEQDFSSIKQELNNFFDIKINENKFSITPKYFAEDIVKTLYQENEVTIKNDVKKNGAYFTVKITSGTETYSFNLIYNIVSEITFDSSGVIF